MTNREIDALVAEKVMGRPGVACCPHCSSPVNEGVLFPGIGCTKPCGWKLLYSEGASLVPHYSTEIADAWEVVEELQKKEYRVVIAYFSDREANALGAGLPGKVNVRLISLSVRHPLNSGAWADTPSMAICLAALKAVSVEVPA